MTTQTSTRYEVGISTLKRGGKIVAFLEGATFSADEILTIGPEFKEYGVTFPTGETARVRATHKIHAIKLVGEKFYPPYSIGRIIYTYRHIADYPA